MSSAACYTNKVKVVAYSKNTKVEYPGNVAINSDPLFASLGCNPRFALQKYTVPPSCGVKRGYAANLQKCIRR